eukprot:577604-Amphidinium_carterae.1
MCHDLSVTSQCPGPTTQGTRIVNSEQVDKKYECMGTAIGSTQRLAGSLLVLRIVVVYAGTS